MNAKKKYVSPKVAKLEFDFNVMVTASGDHEFYYNEEEDSDCGTGGIVTNAEAGFCDIYLSY